MTWPLIERELRVALRRHQVSKMRMRGTFICAGFTFLYLLANFATSEPSWGKSLNTLLFWGGLIIISQIPKYCVGIFAEERRNQTLGLLFLSGIGPVDLFISKTTGAALVSFSRLLIIYPFIGVAFFGGGLSLESFIATMISLPTLLLFAFSVSILASVLCTEESSAMFVTLLLAGLFCGVPLVLSYTIDPISAPETLLQIVSVINPAQPALLASTQWAGTLSLERFFIMCGFSIFWSSILLFVAGFTLNRVWQDKPDSAKSSKTRTRALIWLNQKLHGDFEWRKVLSVKWSDTNPFVWLAIRDRWPTALGFIVVCGCILILAAACIIWPHGMIRPLNFMIAAFVMNYLVGWIVLFTAAKTIGDNRRSGALELLLTTPLTHLDIIRGQAVALREQFRPVVRVLFASQLCMMALGTLNRTWTIEAAALYLLIWGWIIYGTTRFVRSFRQTLPMFWDSLVCGRPAYVVLRKSGLISSPAWLVYLFIMASVIIRVFLRSDWRDYPSGSLGEILFVGLALFVWYWMQKIRELKLNKVEEQLAMDFRAVATKPVPEPSDLRYKYWQSGQHFPQMFADVFVGRIIEHINKEKAQTTTTAPRSNQSGHAN